MTSGTGLSTCELRNRLDQYYVHAQLLCENQETKEDNNLERRIRVRQKFRNVVYGERLPN